MPQPGYFDDSIKRRALADLRTIYACAKEAGIENYVFVCFGLLLGVVRNQGFIPNDDDVDMGVLSDKITKEQEDKYVDALKREGMFFARERIEKRTDTDRYTWFSLRKRHNHAKFCHWFWQKHAGFYWHTKAGRWVEDGKHKFGAANHDLVLDPTAAAIMKGIPEGCFDELVSVDFLGVRIRIPAQYGTCLDTWYPGWLLPMRSKSSKRILCQVGKWAKIDTWKVVVGR
jgi:phosphorylcholine metabolism protein LicD